MTTIDIPVRIGSNQLKINISIAKLYNSMTGYEFLQLALKKCKLEKNLSLYALWENENGIERMLNLNEKFKLNVNAKLIIRKYKQSELNLIRNLNENNDAIVRRRKLYEKRCRAVAASAVPTAPQVQVNVEQQPIEPQQQQQQQPKCVKLCKVHESKFVERLNEQNSNFLRYLYVKLKKSNYNLLINESSSGSLESINSCGTSRSTSASSIGLLDGDIDTQHGFESFV